MTNPENPAWWMLIIEDPESLSGSSLTSLLGKIARECDCGFLLLRGVDGSGKGIIRLREIETFGTPIPVADLATLCVDVDQIEWGDFFFSSDGEERLPVDESYALILPMFSLSAKAVDGNYLYLYSREKEVISRINKAFPAASLENLALENLSFPD